MKNYEIGSTECGGGGATNRRRVNACVGGWAFECVCISRGRDSNRLQDCQKG